MAPRVSKFEKKVAYDKKLCDLLDKYTQILVVVADNVGSNMLQNIRMRIRGDSVVLMGKNTMMKRSIHMHSKKTGNTAFLNIIPLLAGNTGLIFTKGDLKEVREEVAKYKVGAPARVGMVSPIDVIIPHGSTGLDPSQTSFFQALDIPTRIKMGTIEIITRVELLKKGDKVGSSEATLLAKLNIRPFSYGLIVESIYINGSVFSPNVLDLTVDDMMDLERFATGVSMVKSLALGVSYPTLAVVSDMLINGYKNLFAVAIATEYAFAEADRVEEYPKNFNKYDPVASVADVEEKKVESEDEYESDELMCCCCHLLWEEYLWEKQREEEKCNEPKKRGKKKTRW